MDFFHGVNYCVNGKYNGFTIIFFHNMNHSAYNYNFTYKNGFKNRPCYFLDYLAKISRLFIYDRPEETLRFNILRKRNTDSDKYSKILEETSITTHCKNLNEFLQFHNIKGPYVLVSHGVGSLYALKFAYLFKEDVKKIMLIQPYEFTPKLGMKMLSNKQNKSSIKQLLKSITNDNIQKLDLHCISVPFFSISLEIPIYSFFNIMTCDKENTKKITRINDFLKKHNPQNYKEYFYKDKNDYLNQSNSLSLAYKIKYAINAK